MIDTTDNCHAFPVHISLEAHKFSNDNLYCKVSKSTTSVFLIKEFITVLLCSPLNKSKLQHTDLLQKEKD